ncbi:unnamed protein product [Chironomus riparius]|uniref:Uncharacterized protein n=1 Tax=Chironomus riparius TaxID=315576 RepID=A0A9N9RUW7_9DIPT|nr:unnamed protein product [Chironomus riparius]
MVKLLMHCFIAICGIHQIVHHLINYLWDFLFKSFDAF